MLSRDYAEALREWAKREGAGKRAQTFAQATEAWLTERGPELAPKTKRGYESSLRRLLPVFGVCRLDEITSPDVKGFLKARSAPVSANRDKACMSAVGRLDGQPVYARCQTHREAAYAHRQLWMRSTLAAVADPLWRALMAGARPGELRMLKRSSVTEQGIELYRPKTGSRSLIEWSPALRLAAYAAVDADITRRDNQRGVASLPVYVFPARGNLPFTVTGAITRRVYRVFEKVKPVG